MQEDNKMKDDFAKLFGGAMSVAANMKKETEQFFYQQMEAVLQKMHLVNREEFEIVKEIAAKARLEQEKLEKRVAELEKQLSGEKKAPKKTKKST